MFSQYMENLYHYLPVLIYIPPLELSFFFFSYFWLLKYSFMAFVFFRNNNNTLIFLNSLYTFYGFLVCFVFISFNMNTSNPWFLLLSQSYSHRHFVSTVILLKCIFPRSQPFLILVLLIIEILIVTLKLNTNGVPSCLHLSAFLYLLYQPKVNHNDYKPKFFLHLFLWDYSLNS